MMKTMLYLMLLGISSGSYAATECHIAKDGVGGTITPSGGSTAAPVVFKAVDDANYYTELDNFDPGIGDLGSYCDSGQQGVALYAYTNSSSAEKSTDGRALFPTNIAGIYYAAKLYSTGGGGGYFPSALNNWTIIDAGSEGKWKDQKLKLTVTLYQTAYFQGNVGNASYITPKDSRTLGQMRIGEADSDDNNPWSISMTTSSFKVPITAATCGAATGNDVDFGEVMFSSLRESHWPASQPLNIKLSGCTNTTWIRFKLASTKAETASDGQYLLTNTLTGSDAATGIGVIVMANFVNKQSDFQWFEPGTEVWGSTSSVGYSQGYTFNFDASLRRSSEALKAGQFKAIGTFTIDYF